MFALKPLIVLLRKSFCHFGDRKAVLVCSTIVLMILLLLSGQSQAAGHKKPFRNFKKPLSDKRESSRRNSAREYQADIVESDARQNGLPITTGTDQGTQRRRADVDDS